MTISSKLTFADHFGVTKEILDSEGFFNVSLLSDLPLFIDPFHLFYSENQEYQELHNQIINYLVFLRKQSIARNGEKPSTQIIEAYYKFPEIKQNWLGFTFWGNKGHGLGKKFALSLNNNFYNFFQDFGIETQAQHLEKLTLIADGVGRDTISDFTTNLILGFLAKKTEEFTLKHIDNSRAKKFTIRKASFDYSKNVWVPKSFILPAYDGTYVLLTPKDLLTKNDTWINRAGLVEDFEQIPTAISNPALRQQLSSYFSKKLNEYAEIKFNKKTKKEVLHITKKARNKAVHDTIISFPAALDVYIKIKEEHGARAKEQSQILVTRTEKFLEHQYRNFAKIVGTEHKKPTSYEEAHARALYFKECIELKDGYKNLYIGDEPADEDWVQRMFWLVWYGSESDVNREPKNGLGETDFKISQGRKDKTLVEFKLARSTSLEKNLLNQLEKYKEVEKTDKGIWVIIFFNDEEQQKIQGIMTKHKLNGKEEYIIVDARKDNKIPPSKI